VFDSKTSHKADLVHIRQAAILVYGVMYSSAQRATSTTGYAMSRTRNDQVPRVINGRFSVLRTVGAGGFGQVFFSYDREVGQLCAIKLLHEHLASRPDIQKSFEREARAWLTLGRHPHIVSANAVDVFNGRLFISVEYVPPNQAGDNSLEKLLRRQTLSVEQALRLALQLSEAMTYAQTKGLVAHRDLKPNNLMVDANEFLKVTDFGLSLFSISKLSVQESPKGTPLYMAPEAFEKNVPINAKLDIYSAGIILYNLMSDGQMPFKIRRVQDALSFKYFHRLHATYQPIKLECPIWPIIARCLEKVPSERYDSFHELYADLTAAYRKLTGMSYRSISASEMGAYEHINFAASFMILDDSTHALFHIDEAIRLKPHFMPAHSNKAAIYASLSRNDEAEKIWTKVAEAAPELGRPLYNLANQKMQKGNYFEAIELYQKALTREPSYYQALVNLGISYSKIDRPNDALDCYSRASAICPNDSQIMYNIGVQLYEMARYGEAIKTLRQALSLNPNHTSALNYMGLCFAEIGKESEALKYFDAAIGTNPSYAHALSNKVKLGQGAWKKRRFWQKLFGKKR
jgi:serine/threonine protein kinase